MYSRVYGSVIHAFLGCGANCCGDCCNGCNKHDCSGCGDVDDILLGRGTLLGFSMVGFAGLDRLSLNTVSDLGFHFANNGLLGNQVIQGYEAVTNCGQVQFGGESSDVAVEVIDDLFQLSVFFSGIGHITDEVVHDMLKLAAAAPMLLPEIVCDGDLQALGGNKDQVAVNMHGDIQATLSQFALDASLQ